VYTAIEKPEDSVAQQFWVDGIAIISTAATGENYLWMYHTIHTPNIMEIQIDLWTQMDVQDYISPPPEIPLVITAIINAAGGKAPYVPVIETPPETNEESTEPDEPSSEVVEEPTGTNRVQEPELAPDENKEPEEAPEEEPEILENPPSGRRLQDEPEEQEKIYSSWQLEYKV